MCIGKIVATRRVDRSGRNVYFRLARSFTPNWQRRRRRRNWVSQSQVTRVYAEVIVPGPECWLESTPVRYDRVRL